MDRIILRRVKSAPSQSTDNGSDKKKENEFKTPSVPRQKTRGTKRSAKEMVIHLQNGSGKFPALAGIKKQKISDIPKTKIDTKKKTEKIDIFSSLQQIKEQNLDLRPQKQTIKANICESFNKHIDFVVSTSNGTAEIDNQMLMTLYKEAAGLNHIGNTNKINVEQLVKLLNLLEANIKIGTQITPPFNKNIQLFRRSIEKVLATTDACLICMYIMTSKNMPKRVYLEELIHRVMNCINHIIANTILPAIDPTYTAENKTKENCQNSKVTYEKSFILLTVKITELVYLIAELIDVLTLDETAISLVFSIGTATFWAKNVQNLQIANLNLVTKLFKTYKTHQTDFLNNILSSLMLVPTTKQHLKTYILKDGTNISIVSALVLQLIQSMITLPDNIFQKNTKTKTKDKVDISTLICTKYQETTFMAGAFLTIFFQRCFKKQKNTDHRSLFENFVQDLFLVRNNPEFPGADLMLCLLGKMLVKIFLNKDDEIALRVVSLDCLTIIAAKLRKDNVLFTAEKANISNTIFKIKRNEQNSSQKEAEKSKIDVDVLSNDDKFLQRLLLEFLDVNSQQTWIYKNARLFYLVQWYKDFASKESQLGLDHKEKSDTKKRNQKYKSSSKAKSKSNDNENVQQGDPEITRQIAEKEKFLLEKIQESLSPEFQHQVYEYQIEYNEAKMIVALLASKRYFSQSFDQYFNAILIVLKDASKVLRTKGLKCLTTIIETDPTVLESNDTQLMISKSFIDPSASVREAVVDLLVKFILYKPELITKCYDMLSARILDTGINIRKRVIKILNEICLDYPDFEKNTEICVKIIRRINDEDSVKELVLKIFQNMWFTCASGSKLFKKVTRIVEVVAASQDLENFEQLLFELLTPSDGKYNSSKSKFDHPNEILRASRQIVDFLMEPTLRSPNKHNYESPEKLAAILKTLHIFAKVRPQLLVRHVTKLQSYLELQEESPKDNGTVGSVIAMLELAIPLSENPSDIFLAQLEEQIMKLLLRYDRTIVNSCLSCLAVICNKITHKYDAIRDCFTKFYNCLVGYTNWQSNGLSTEEHAICKAVIKRSLFIVGLLLKYFDFKDPEVLGELAPDTTDQVYRTMLCFLQKDSIDIQVNTLKAIGIICSRYYQFLWENQLLKTFYYEQLASKEASLLIRVEILNNIENFLKEEDIRLIEDNKNWHKISKKTDLKQMDDVSSGIASMVIQYYLKVILNCYVHDSLQIRQAVFRVVHMILRQGLVHPIHIVPYLICMSTDCEQMVALNADKSLNEIENRYPGLIHTGSTLGIQLSFQLQKILKQEKVVRGFKVKEKEEYPVALNGHLYSLLRGSRQQRRALILFSLKEFEEPTELALSYMIYLADNMAYFPYQVQDEPLFLVHYIDIKIVLFGTNLVQNFKNGLNSVKKQTKNKNSDERTDDLTGVDIDEEEEDEKTILSRLPKDTSQLQACMSTAQGWLLLLDLKQYIVDVYGLSHEDSQLYSPSAAAKVYEKPVQRKSNIMFDPKITLEKLKEICLGKQLKAKNKTTLVREYIDFSRLVNSI
ncbi:unnamed protein product [Diabrotica balteata]|uniref:Nipped-B protein n=1 Tax=Diabrotica balteata TaxID=107213 RepID=A0A9N9SMG5_DIABA|nr:unnamed protein product [Diabrotica balteata]